MISISTPMSGCSPISATRTCRAFFFDIRKDSLYCDATTSPKRMAYRTVLDTLFHALVRYAAPVLVFTAEEVWFPDEAESPSPSRR
jgi:isoleucyl-tRNA synthetase